ncbi:MAG: hypothetical protein M3N37_09300 [Actinomycetota bacterium]|nr:hypothetical protein [Actinomycetota bacterium]MDP8955088.1 hypothetical protein [Actinomycetota bacterium]
MTSRQEPSSVRAREGRVCREEDCHTRLSIYNDGPFCSVHEPMSTPRTRGRKIA